VRSFVVDKDRSPKGIKPVELQRPFPKSKEVLVSVKGSTINPADYKVLTGEEGWKFLHSTNSPLQLGFDCSGIIEEVGTHVSGFSVGDEVFGFLPYSSSTVQGAYSEYITIKGTQIARRPQDLSHADSATLPTVASTASQILYDIVKLRKGSKVLINGASGGVGIYLIQMAKNLFQCEVWGIAGTRSLEFIRELGVKEAIDYNLTSIREIDEEFDLIIDVVSNSSFGECRKILSPRGSYVILHANRRFVGGLISSMFSSKNCKMVIVLGQNRTLSRISEWVDSGKIKVYTSATFSVENLGEAFTEFKKGGTKGKIAISVSL